MFHKFKMNLTFLILTGCLAATSAFVFNNTELQHQLEADYDVLEDQLASVLSGVITGNIKTNNKIVLNQYVDKIFSVVRDVVGKNFNSISLPDESFKAKKLAGGNIYNGKIIDISTIYRSEDVFVAIDTAQKKITLQFPFKFDDIKIHYDFYVKALLIKSHGGITGSVKDLHFTPVFSFDYKSDTLKLEHYDMKHTGSISVKFTGAKLIDWAINGMSKLFTSILHPTIVKITQNEVGAVLQKLIAKLNGTIHRKIHH